jgi:hypothetical protein
MTCCGLAAVSASEIVLFRDYADPIALAEALGA